MKMHMHGRVRGAVQVAVIGFAVVLAVACANTPKEPSRVTAVTDPVANTAAAEADANYYVNVEFKPGSDQLTERSRAAIGSLMDRARGQGELKEVKVLSWADEEYPSGSRKKLSDRQKKLAQNRNKNIEAHIDSLRFGVDVDTYSMAERPNVVSQWLSTSDARFKRSLEAAGLPTTDSEASLRKHASKSVVLVRIE